MAEKGEKGIIKNFSPAWFAIVMGTGGLANVFFILGKSSNVAGVVAVALWLLNTVLFVVLILPWVSRWIAYRQQAMMDIKHPMMSNFFVTMPAGCLVLASNFMLIGRHYLSVGVVVGLGLTLWIIGAVLSFIFAVVGMYNLTTAEAIGPDPINYAWLMMPVVNVIIPLPGNLLVKAFFTQGSALAAFVNLVDVIFFGIGMMLFLIMAAVVTNRLIMHKLPPSMTAPTFWVLLGPVGIGTVSLMGLADIAKIIGIVSDVSALKFAALALWGFGLWAFVFTLAVTVRYMRSEGIPFSLSWWAFIFPLAAYTLGTFSVFEYTQVPVVKGYALLLTALLALLWLVTFARTLTGAVSGRLFAPPPAPRKA